MFTRKEVVKIITVPSVFGILLAIFLSVRGALIALKMCWISIIPFQHMDVYSFNLNLRSKT